MTARNHPVRIQPYLAGRKQSLVQTMAETLRQFDKLFVSQQAHDVPELVVHSPAVITPSMVFLDPKPELRRHIALQVIGQLSLDLIAVDLYETRFARHEYHRSIRCRNTKKVTLAIIFFPSN